MKIEIFLKMSIILMHIWADSQQTSYYYYSTIKHTSSNKTHFCRYLRLFSHHQFSNIPSVMLYFSLSSPQSTIVIAITIYSRQGDSHSERKSERQHVTILQRVTNPLEALLSCIMYYVVLCCYVLRCITLNYVVLRSVVCCCVVLCCVALFCRVLFSLLSCSSFSFPLFLPILKDNLDSL